MSAVKRVIKKPVVKKYFRLFDFNTYDEIIASEDSGSGSDNETGNFKKRTDDKVFVIQMFGVNETGETCCIYIKDFQPFFFIRVGQRWTDSDAAGLVREIQGKIDKKYKDSIKAIRTDCIQSIKELPELTVGNKYLGGFKLDKVILVDKDTAQSENIS